MIVYTKDGEPFDGVPTEPGEYTASVTFGTETASVSYTITEPEAEVEFLGGSLRKRVTEGTNEVVYTSTDIRFGFTFELPEGAVLDQTASCFYWEIGGDVTAATGRKLAMTNYADNGDGTWTANLVITGVPARNYETDIAAMLHVAFTVNGVSFSTDSEVGVRSVRTVCERLIDGEDIPEAWKEYAAFLLEKVTAE